MLVSLLEASKILNANVSKLRYHCNKESFPVYKVRTGKYGHIITKIKTSECESFFAECKIDRGKFKIKAPAETKYTFNSDPLEVLGSDIFVMIQLARIGTNEKFMLEQLEFKSYELEFAKRYYRRLLERWGV